jgi:hypothetical protein
MIQIDMPMPKSCEECFFIQKCNGFHMELCKDEDGFWTTELIADKCPLSEVIVDE